MNDFVENDLVTRLALAILKEADGEDVGAIAFSTVGALTEIIAEVRGISHERALTTISEIAIGIRDWD